MEAQRLQHVYMGTEHLLLALLAENGGGAAAVLASCGADIDSIRARLQEMQEVGNEVVSEAMKLPFTPRAKEVLNFALEESERLGHDRVGTADLLLGLLREGYGIAAQALLDSLDLSKACQEAARVCIPDIDDLTQD